MRLYIFGEKKLKNHMLLYFNAIQLYIDQKKFLQF